jgi:hypothetical protein
LLTEANRLETALNQILIATQNMNQSAARQPGNMFRSNPNGDNNNGGNE